MKHLVEIKGKKTYVTSRVIAQECGTQHESVKRLIKVHRKYMTGVHSPELKSREYKTPGMTGAEYLLDEAQATFLLTLMKNDDKVIVPFKRKLVDEFLTQRQVIANLIAQQKDPNWQDVRRDGKKVYFQKTDVIKQFVEYAEWEGSQSANMYYMNLAKMENKYLFVFVLEKKYPNLRELLTIRQLMQVATADTVIEKALKEGMDRKLPYKECYKLAKERIIAFAEIIGQSPILSLEVK